MVGNGMLDRLGNNSIRVHNYIGMLKSEGQNKVFPKELYFRAYKIKCYGDTGKLLFRNSKCQGGKTKPSDNYQLVA